MKTRALAPILVAITFLGGCLGIRQGETPPDQRFGHRVEGIDDEGRETVMVAPPDEATGYRTDLATVESVTVRPGGAEPDVAGVSVEVLVKGAFPDACTELHEVSQVRSGNLVEVTLQTRRPEGAICAMVIRPYRFYVVLEGRYDPGAYNLKLNGTSYPFEVR